MTDYLSKHKHILLDRNTPLKDRLKFFDMDVSPTILFGISILPMSDSKLEGLEGI